MEIVSSFFDDIHDKRHGNSREFRTGPKTTLSYTIQTNPFRVLNFVREDPSEKVMVHNTFFEGDLKAITYTKKVYPDKMISFVAQLNKNKILTYEDNSGGFYDSNMMGTECPYISIRTIISLTKYYYDEIHHFYRMEYDYDYSVNKRAWQMVNLGKPNSLLDY